MKRTLGLLTLMFALFAAPAASSTGDLRHSAPAVSGFDVVSYRTGEKPLRGNGNHVAIFQGATYLFVNEANRRTFERNPAKYVPAYGGYCALGVSLGEKFVGDPDVWRVADDRLYLNLDTRAQEVWGNNLRRNIEAADSRWTEVRDDRLSAAPSTNWAAPRWRQT